MYHILFFDIDPNNFSSYNNTDISVFDIAMILVPDIIVTEQESDTTTTRVLLHYVADSRTGNKEAAKIFFLNEGVIKGGG